MPDPTNGNDYFAVEALSNSGIKRLLKSPRHFRHWTDNPKKLTPALRQGQALHAIVLEKNPSKIAVFEGTKKAKTLNSQDGAYFLAANEGMICLDLEEWGEVAHWASAISADEKVSRLIASCRTEVQIYGQEPSAFGPINSKAMLDGINPGLILDLKTTEDDADRFPWTARKYQYDIQAAWYEHMAYTHLDGLRREVYFVVIEKNPPYGILLYEAKPETMQEAWKKCREAIEIYGQCKALNRWDSYDTNEIRQF